MRHRHVYVNWQLSAYSFPPALLHSGPDFQLHNHLQTSLQVNGCLQPVKPTFVCTINCQERINGSSLPLALAQPQTAHTHCPILQLISQHCSNTIKVSSSSPKKMGNIRYSMRKLRILFADLKHFFQYDDIIKYVDRHSKLHSKTSIEALNVKHDIQYSPSAKAEYLSWFGQRFKAPLKHQYWMLCYIVSQCELEAGLTYKKTVCGNQRKKYREKFLRTFRGALRTLLQRIHFLFSAEFHDQTLFSKPKT